MTKIKIDDKELEERLKKSNVFMSISGQCLDFGDNFKNISKDGINLFKNLKNKTWKIAHVFDEKWLAFKTWELIENNDENCEFKVCETDEVFILLCCNEESEKVVLNIKELFKILL